MRRKNITGKVLSAVANCFGFSTNYGIRVIPYTSPISIPVIQGIDSENLSRTVSLIIKNFFQKPHPRIEEKSTDQILATVISNLYQSVYRTPEQTVDPTLSSQSPSLKQESEDSNIQSGRTIVWHKDDIPSSLQIDPPPLKTKVTPTEKNGTAAVKSAYPSLWKIAAAVGSVILLGGAARAIYGGGESQSNRTPDDPNLPLSNISNLNNISNVNVMDVPVAPSPQLTAVNDSLFESLHDTHSWLGNSEALLEKRKVEAFAKEIDAMRQVGQIIEEVHYDKIIYKDGSVYEGEMDWYTDQPSGMGRLEDKEGNVISEGKWEKGILVDGKGMVLLDEDSIFIGPIRDNLPAGVGIKRSSSGEEDYVVEGYGRLQLENGNAYIGSIENHQPSGYGEIRSEKGELIQEGIFRGKELVKAVRTLSLNKGEMFRGEVDSEGRPDGFGVVFSEKGLSFGHFKEGKRLGSPTRPQKAPMLLFTSFTGNRAAFNKPVVDNHKAYAEKHGYHYVEFIENLAADFESMCTEGTEKQTLPYWSKIAGMLRLLNLLDPSKFPKEVQAYLPKELIWLDDDAVFTNKGVKVEDVVNHYSPPGSQTHLFLTQDSMHAQGFDLNTALLFTRNSPESRSIFSTIWNRRLKKVQGGSYGNCPDQSCLHEQAALQDLKKLPAYGIDKYVKVIPQRDALDPAGGWGINVFHRKSHMDSDRFRFLDYDDPIETRWKEGDFIGQATGMASMGYLRDGTGERNLREAFMLELVDAAKEKIDAAKEKTIIMRIFKALQDFFERYVRTR